MGNNEGYIFGEGENIEITGVMKIRVGMTDCQVNEMNYTCSTQVQDVRRGIDIAR